MFEYLACSSYSNQLQTVVYVKQFSFCTIYDYFCGVTFISHSLFMLVLMLQSTTCLNLAFFFPKGTFSSLFLLCHVRVSAVLVLFA